MRHFFTTRVKVVLIVAVVLAIVLGVVSGLTNMSIPDMLVKGVLTPVRAGVSKLADGAEQLYSYMFGYESLAAENQQLKEQLAQMEDDARLADSLSRENERLRDALEMKTAHSDYKFADGYIISWDSGEWSSTFTINQGKNAGIAENMCAVTANGELVGLVSEVGPNYAVVKSVLDSSLEISATIAASGYNGMVQGGYATGEEGYLRMNYLPSGAVICNHDQVVTAGSTLYPRDLVLGSVIDAGFDETGVAKFAILEPAADFGSLEQIFVLTSYKTE